MMKRILAPVLLALLAPVAAQAADPPLVHLAVKDVPVENGKVLDMEFHEIERGDTSSTVHVIRRSGGSVSSTMFILRGVCAVMRARGQHYVVADRVPGEDEDYVLTFPKPLPGEDRKGFRLAGCDLLNF